ncbi:bifunctional UDP-N-acetylglucosamine pyrophosphorylase / Glucosamine-1-phosphate N-acetyltransferase [Ectothiorhodosinus mongolicus]|uniref:Bifunctional protein GlmU n=2 Tax=Ectothiorhodosinus mongolicus TaxID=233100 RepID=A0A1R3VVR6_9GAMM|nr:bifunctional UDP-N-acetylglucosamine pyrophosphorylase / Glucosamine-1-phosphate N-acetyltransferase [Ectothiorhodosinus mongolicus]
MRSQLPKVLHPLGGKPLLGHVLDTAFALEPDRVLVVIGHGAEAIRAHFPDPRIHWVVQPEQLGTGHAVRLALPEIGEQDDVLVMYGDIPCVPHEALHQLLSALDEHSLVLQSMRLGEPKGYGRILRSDAGQPLAIIEEKDASAAQRALTEVNTGFLAAQCSALTRWLEVIEPQNAQGEYYLTDCLGLAVAEQSSVAVLCAEDSQVFFGINDRLQLAAMERFYQAGLAKQLLQAGVTLLDPERLDIRGRLSAASDVTVDVNVVFEGDVVLEAGVRIGPNCVIRNAHIGANTVVQAHCVIEEAVVGANASIGPFARLRPGAWLADETHVGNFVEIKNSTIAKGSKVNHLSYIGDAELGEKVNVGAGTITCNYDGAHKHRTVIGDHAFIGSNTALVAPVEVGADATIGAGSTITRAAPEGKLTLSRASQKTFDAWVRPKKQNRES